MSDLNKQILARLQELEDKEAIRSVLNQYCIRPDNYDFAGYAQLYTEDGTMGFSQWGPKVGHAAIEQACAAERVYEGLLHMMTNMEITIDGPTTAHATARVFFCATPKLDRLGENYAFGGPYEYTFVKRAEGWKIRSMVLKKTWEMGTDTEGVFVN
ncbi:hypothetical protein BGZ57DRAFT_1004338 [Hyaloscypha finlandica]|nr:hypothetical protein BGZ57DRAFT_1004338 [Hyaloscypha finlandica]